MCVCVSDGKGFQMGSGRRSWQLELLKQPEHVTVGLERERGSYLLL